jgi:hypothetical protein
VAVTFGEVDTEGDTETLGYVLILREGLTVVVLDVNKLKSSAVT